MLLLLSWNCFDSMTRVSTALKYTYVTRLYTSHACVLSMRAKLLQSCPTLCYLMDRSPPGSSVHGVLWARTLEWVAIPFSREFSQPRDQAHVSYGFCIGRQVLYHWCHEGSPYTSHQWVNTRKSKDGSKIQFTNNPVT